MEPWLGVWYWLRLYFRWVTGFSSVHLHWTSLVGPGVHAETQMELIQAIGCRDLFYFNTTVCDVLYERAPDVGNAANRWVKNSEIKEQQIRT